MALSPYLRMLSGIVCMATIILSRQTYVAFWKRIDQRLNYQTPLQLERNKVIFVGVQMGEL